MLPPSGVVAPPSAEPTARFRSLQPLGIGGIGEVVLVEDRDIDRRVAIKRLRPEQRSVPALARFAEEVRIIGQLEHPNITPVHDVGVDDHGQAAGDPARVDQRADIYSLSLTFLEWMTLSHPLAKVSAIDEVLAAQRRGAVDLAGVMAAFEAAAAPREYAPAIARGLEVDPVHRFASVTEMIEELRRLQAGEIPVRCHITLTKRAARELEHFADRRPALYTALLFAFLVLFVAGLGALALYLVKLAA